MEKELAKLTGCINVLARHLGDLAEGGLEGCCRRSEVLRFGRGALKDDEIQTGCKLRQDPATPSMELVEISRMSLSNPRTINRAGRIRPQLANAGGLLHLNHPLSYRHSPRPVSFHSST
jgi:hypothetical protein